MTPRSDQHGVCESGCCFLCSIKAGVLDSLNRHGRVGLDAASMGPLAQRAIAELVVEKLALFDEWAEPPALLVTRRGAEKAKETR